MAGQGRQLGLNPGRHIQGGGHILVGSAQRVNGIHRKGRRDAPVGHLPPPAAEHIAGEADIVEQGRGAVRVGSGGAGRRGGSVSRHRFVVGVAVAAGGVVGQHDMGAGFGDDAGDAGDYGVGIGVAVGVGMAVVVSAVHAAVAVVEEAQVGHAGNFHSVAEFLLADLPQVFGGGQGRVADFAHIAVGGADQRNPRAAGRQHRQQAAGSKALIVGMGVAGEDGEAGNRNRNWGSVHCVSFHLILVAVAMVMAPAAWAGYCPSLPAGRRASSFRRRSASASAAMRRSRSASSRVSATMRPSRSSSCVRK